MRYTIATGPDGVTLALWRGGPLDPEPVIVTSQYAMREDPEVWDLLAETYGGRQSATLDEVEELASDYDQSVTYGPDTACVDIDGTTYEAPLAQVPA